MNRFSIRDIENLTGIKAHTIRIWEQRYGILQPKRTPTNIRYYDGDDLKLALRIALLNQYGYKISRIQKMDDSEINKLIQKIHDDQFQLQIQVNDLLEATLELDTEKFETVLNGFINKNGIEATVETLIFAFLDKIGVMWMTDRLFPAQEHIVSNIIYRKIAAAIEGLPSIDSKNESLPSVLLYLPEGEIHDISLLYVYYILKKHKKKPIYLGPNSPMKEVDFVYQHKPIDYIYTHLTSVSSEFDGNNYLKKLSSSFPNAKIYVSGTMLRGAKYDVQDNIQFIYSLEEARNILTDL